MNELNNENKCVLFWDDEINTRKRLLFKEIKMGLEQEGWRPVFFTEREDAIKSALTENYDVIVLDLKEKGQNVGIDFLKAVRAQKPFLPVVIFTLWGDPDFMYPAFREDISYFLKMPVRDYHDVIRALEVAIDREKFKERLVQDRFYASVGKLAAGVAHFIKNSLWNIISRAQYLKDKKIGGPDDMEMLEVILRRSSDANHVVSNLLKFAGREASAIKETEFDLVSLVKEILNLVEYECETLKIEKIDDIQCEAVMMSGIELELREAFLNIVKNAIEAMPKGGVLTTQMIREDEKIIVRISDTGAGMTEDVKKKLFIPFFTTKDNSTGFGLFDTRRIIFNHEGAIEYESEPGKGAEAVVTLPLRRKRIALHAEERHD